MFAGTLCRRIVATASPEETIAVAARRMVRNDVGTLVVLEGRGSNRVVGLVTDRDITTRCVAAGVDPEETAVSTVMSAPVRMIAEGASIEDALGLMATEGTRRLVVADDDDHLIGLLSLDDILKVTVEDGSSVHRLLDKQRPHIPA